MQEMTRHLLEKHLAKFGKCRFSCLDLIMCQKQKVIEMIKFEFRHGNLKLSFTSSGIDCKNSSFRFFRYWQIMNAIPKAY